MTSGVPLDPDLESSVGAAVPLAHWFWIFFGGATGTLARYLVLKTWIAHQHSTPWALIAINASGSLVLGLLITTLFKLRPNWNSLRLTLSTGFLGGWTTYSSFAVASLLLIHQSAWGPLANLAIATVLVCPLLALLGRQIGTKVVSS